MNKVYMKGYKAFNSDMTCKGKQYKENTIFKEDSAEICEKGMHFCKEPLEVLTYYPLVNDKGEISRFAEVEALDKCETDDNEKFCTKKLKVKGKIDFAKLVNIAVDFDYEKLENSNILNDNGGYYAKIGSSGDSAQIGSSGNYAQIGSSGDSAKIGSSGYYAKIGSSGDSAQIGSSGDSAQIGSSGGFAKIGSSGNYAQIGSSGDSAQIGSSGGFAKIGSSGYSAQIGSSGGFAKIGSSGYSAQIGSSGDSAKIGSSGYYAKIGSSGDSAQIGSSGDSALINSIGKDSVIMCAGMDSIAKAKKGSWITLTEWEYNDKKKRDVPINVVTKKVDGKEIKEDTYYRLEKGKFVEVNANE